MAIFLCLIGIQIHRHKLLFLKSNHVIIRHSSDSALVAKLCVYAV